MRPCLKCGAPASEAAVTCPSCGALLPTAIGQNLHQTLLGHAPPEPVLPRADRAPTSATMKGTMMGLGLATPTRPSDAPPAPAPAPAASAQGLRGTMIGMAPPSPPPPPPEGRPPEALDPNLAAFPTGGKRTMVGIARPGIAPLNPGIEKPLPVPEDLPPAAPWPPPQPSLVAPSDSAVDVVAGLPRPLRIPPAAALAIVGAAALFTAAIVALLLYRSRGSITASVTASAEGRERLLLTCTGCSNESKVRLAGREGAFRDTHAELELGAPLPVGDNKVTVELERRPGRSEQVELEVPVDYRVRADTGALSQAPPRVTVRVEVVPHSAVVVDGKPLAPVPGPSGPDTATAEIDVSRSLTGMSANLTTLEREIPYVVTPPNGSPSSGQVKVRVGVTPLVVQAPGSSIVIEAATFVLAGHTAKDASVSVEGRPITVDGTGAFAQMMSVSSLGETNIIVRSDAKDQAPRLVPVKVRRVQSLAAEATAVRARATTSFAAIEKSPADQRGLAVALDGSVVEARAEAFTTVLLMDVKSGCASAPCLARVSVGEKLVLAPGSGVSVFGTVTGAVDGPHAGTRIPALAADFVLKGRP